MAKKGYKGVIVMIISVIVAGLGVGLMLSAICGALIGILFNDDIWEVDE